MEESNKLRGYVEHLILQLEIQSIIFEHDFQSITNDIISSNIYDKRVILIVKL